MAPADAHSDDDLLDRLRSGVRAAVKARDRRTAAVLRSVLGEVDNAGAVAAADGLAEVSSPHIAGAVAGLGRAEATRRHLDGSAVATVVRTEVDARRESADAPTTPPTRPSERPSSAPRQGRHPGFVPVTGRWRTALGARLRDLRDV